MKIRKSLKGSPKHVKQIAKMVGILKSRGYVLLGIEVFIPLLAGARIGKQGGYAHADAVMRKGKSMAICEAGDFSFESLRAYEPLLRESKYHEIYHLPYGAKELTHYTWDSDYFFFMRYPPIGKDDGKFESYKQHESV